MYRLASLFFVVASLLPAHATETRAAQPSIVIEGLSGNPASCSARSAERKLALLAPGILDKAVTVEKRNPKARTVRLALARTAPPLAARLPVARVTLVLGVTY